MDRRNEVAEHQWFHAIDFGDFASQGRFKPGQKQNITLYGTFEFLAKTDLSGARLLDIGTYDGIVAFGAKALGAESVVAIDTYRNPSFLLARELLEYDTGEIEYRPGIQIAALQNEFEPQSFDLVCCCGVIYHMLRPMEAFTETRKLLKPGGMLILETPFASDRDDAVLVFNGVEKVVNEPYTYFVPTRKALEGMAQLAGFRIVADRELKAPKRVTFLLQAVDRAELVEDPDTFEFIVQMLKRDTCDDGFRFRDIESRPAATPSPIRLKTDMPRHREIDARWETVAFPYHPEVSKPAFGKTRFETADGNTKVL